MMPVMPPPRRLGQAKLSQDKPVSTAERAKNNTAREMRVPSPRSQPRYPNPAYSTAPRFSKQKSPEPSLTSERLSHIVDPNGAYMEAPATTPALRTASMAVLGLFIGAGLMLIGASLSKAGVESKWLTKDAANTSTIAQNANQAKETTGSIVPKKDGSKTIFVENNAKDNFHVFSMPMKIQRVASYVETPSDTAKEIKPAPSTIKRIKAQTILHTPEVAAAAGPMSRRSVCVRMCDGFYFPLGNQDGRADTNGQEAMCKAACPGTTTKLFTIPAGAEGIDQAVSSQGKSYRSIPMAYAHESGRDETCSCRLGSAGLQPTRVALLNDPTLRAGDAVVIDGQAKVFKGKSGREGRINDFSDFRTSTTLSSTDRQKLDQMVGVSRQEQLYRQIQSRPRVRDAKVKNNSQQDGNTESMRIVVRSGTSTGERTTVRIVTPSPFSAELPVRNR
jgi:hypothetical protein